MGGMSEIKREGGCCCIQLWKIEPVTVEKKECVEMMDAEGNTQFISYSSLSRAPRRISLGERVTRIIKS